LTSPGAQPASHRQGGWPDERRTSYQRIACDRCAAVVEVAKFSAQQTSVQWSPESVRACAEFAARAAGGEPSALIDTCGTLRDSIGAALLQGRLAVSPP
jgi:hypothetical protein